MQVPDIRLDPNYQLTGPVASAGMRSMLGVPMIQNGQVIGVIGLGREAPGPYSDKSIALQPLSVQAQTGLNLAAGVASLRLKRAK